MVHHPSILMVWSGAIGSITTRTALTILICLTLATPALAAASATQFTARVIAVSDGNTITVLTPDKKHIEIRLYGIYSPETGQPFGTRAKQSASDAVLEKNVIVQPMDVDAYGRMVAVVSIPGQTKNLNATLVREGMAWVYALYCKNQEICWEIKNMEQVARAMQHGLWADKNPVPPWEWGKR